MMAEQMGGTPGGTIGEPFNVPLTAHFMGGCAIGDTPETGVIDPYQRLFGHEGLHVVDGSAISGNLGVNPSLTITAQAERAMSYWPNKGEADVRPAIGEGYRRIEPMAPKNPVVPADAPAALQAPDHRRQLNRQGAAAATTKSCGTHSGEHEVAQPEVQPGDRDRHQGHEQAVLGEAPERDRMAVARGDPEDHHVGARAHGGRVAAEVGAKGQRPPQGMGLRRSVAGLAPGRGRSGVIVATKGMLSTIPENTAEPQSSAEPAPK